MNAEHWVGSRPVLGYSRVETDWVGSHSVLAYSRVERETERRERERER